MQASPEHRHHRIVGKQAKRLVEVVRAQMHLAQQHGARCAIPRSHAAVCRRHRTHETQDRPRELPLVGRTIDAHLTAVGEEDVRVPSGRKRRDRTRHHVSWIGERNVGMQQGAALQHPVARGTHLSIVVRCRDLPGIAAAERQRQTTKAIELGPAVHGLHGDSPSGAVNPDLEGLVVPGVLHQLVQRLQLDPQVVQLRRRPPGNLCNRLVDVSRITQADGFDPDVQPLHAGTAPIQVARLSVGTCLRVQCGSRCGHRQDDAQSGTTHAPDPSPAYRLASRHQRAGHWHVTPSAAYT